MTSYIGVWKPIYVNRSNRPILEDGEHTVYVRDNVGLYQGKEKILKRQNGRVYLTNKRVIYLDNEVAANSMAIDINDIVHTDPVDGFLKSSPKVKLYIKDDFQDSKDTILQPQMADWACQICSFNNLVSVDVDLDNDLPVCVSCGIKPSKAWLSKAIKKKTEQTTLPAVDNQCLKCTFVNHPSMTYCEMCGSVLSSAVSQKLLYAINGVPSKKPNSMEVTDGTNPSEHVDSQHNKLNITLENNTESYSTNRPYVKLSFRKGGNSEFIKHIRNIVDDAKWLNALERGAISQNSVNLSRKGDEDKPTIRGSGIHALEQIGEQQRRQNEFILSNSLEDLEQLMYKYLDLLNLSNSFSKLVNNKPINLNHILPFNVKKTSDIYHQELARHISEYLTNYELTQNSSMITSHDLFANINRFLILTRGFGSDLIAPVDFNKAIKLTEELDLPVKVKYYEDSGIEVISLKNELNYNKFIVQHLKKLEYDFRYNKLQNEILSNQDLDHYFRDEYDYFKGDTVSGISGALNWSYSIAIEEVENCVAEGSIVVDQNHQGTFYFVNKFNEKEYDPARDEEKLRRKVKQDLLDKQRSITENLKMEYLNNKPELIDFRQDYDFGMATPQSDSSQTGESNVQSPASTSLNDLRGLIL